MTTRSGFQQDLEELERDILKMGGLVEKAIDQAVQALAKQDRGLAQQVVAGDQLIDDLELEIEDRCMKLIATQQPMARDLRRIGTGFRIITDLERMADYAVDVARVAERLAGETLIKPLIDIPRMAELAQRMVSHALDAYVREDVQMAYNLAVEDDQVDHLYHLVFDELLLLMQEDPRKVKQATYLLFVGRYLERIADHATNIAEGTIYLVTGEKKFLND